MYFHPSMQLHLALNSSWHLVGAGCCQGLRGEEEGEGRSGRGSFDERLKEKGRTSSCQLHVETFTIIIISISSKYTA